MKKLQSFQIGDMVRVRGERWRITDVRAHSACSLVSLSGTGSQNRGRAAQVLAPFDDLDLATESRTIRLVGPRRWRHHARSIVAHQGPADRLASAERARIDLHPHQLEPALAIVRGLGCRVLIADDVGLGKTIEAGLIVSELRERSAADRVLVLAPAGLREQWAGELSQRFGLDAAVIDSTSLRRLNAALPIGINPWSTMEVAIASFDYVKRPEVRPAVTSCRWDVIVVDEAHNVNPGSDRHEAIAALCRRAVYVVLITATPHNGSAAAFTALCALGRHDGDRLLVFRRTRAQMALSAGRRVHCALVRPTNAEVDMHQALRDVIRTAAADRHLGAENWLALSVLQKRALSSAFALTQTVGRRLHSMDGGAVEPEQLQLTFADVEGESDPSDGPPDVNVPLLTSAAAERRLLHGLAARSACAMAVESKLGALRRLLRRLDRLHERAIVFTEYRDTLGHIQRSLGIDCAILHGGLTRFERRQQLESFASGRRRVLLATDAAGEGLNLHEACRVVINLELPWNPMRLEQRIGRVDRIGQGRTVHAFHLVGAASGELEVLGHLQRRLSRAGADIAAPDPLGRADSAFTKAIAGVGTFDDVPAHPDETEPGSRDWIAADLATEAARECIRVATARRLGRTAPAIEADSSHCWAASTRRSGTRTVLHDGILAVSRTELSDSVGRNVATRLTALLVRPSARVSRSGVRRHLEHLSSVIEDFARRQDDGAWSVEMERLHGAFVTARRDRIAGILSQLAASVSPAQIGLFDRRRLRAVESHAATIAEATAEFERILGSSPAGIERSNVRTVLLLGCGHRW